MISTKILIAKLKGAERNLEQQIEVSAGIADNTPEWLPNVSGAHAIFYEEYKNKVSKIIKEFEDGLEISNNK